MNQSAEQIQVIRERSWQELTLLKQELQRFQQDNTKWQQQYQQIKEERDGLSKEKLELEHLQFNAKIEMTTMTEKYVGLEQQLKEKHSRIEELRRHHHQVQANLEHYRDASAAQRLQDQQRYEQQQKQLEQNILQLNGELAETKHSKIEFQQLASQATFEKDILSDQLVKLNEQYEAVGEKLTEAVSEVVRKDQAQKHWQEQCHELSLKCEEQNKIFLKQQAQHAVLLHQLEIAKNKINELSKQANNIDCDKRIIAKEATHLERQQLKN